MSQLHTIHDYDDIFRAIEALNNERKSFFFL